MFIAEEEQNRVKIRCAHGPAAGRVEGGESVRVLPDLAVREGHVDVGDARGGGETNMRRKAVDSLLGAARRNKKKLHSETVTPTSEAEQQRKQQSNSRQRN